MNLTKRLLSGILVAVIATGTLGAFVFYRVSAQPPLAANMTVWTVLNPIPKVVQNDVDIVYLLVSASPSGGTAPYRVYIAIAGELVSSWESCCSGSMAGAPVIWSRNAPTSAQTVTIIAVVTDSVSASASQAMTISLPVTSPTA